MSRCAESCVRQATTAPPSLTRDSVTARPGGGTRLRCVLSWRSPGLCGFAGTLPELDAMAVGEVARW